MGKSDPVGNDIYARVDRWLSWNRSLTVKLLDFQLFDLVDDERLLLGFLKVLDKGFLIYTITLLKSF
jgi:hypothetical protein